MKNFAARAHLAALAFALAMPAALLAQTPEPPPPQPADSGLFPTTPAGAGASRQRSSHAPQRFGELRRTRFDNPLLRRAAADSLEVRIAYRRAETEALRDPEFAELLDRAAGARTDVEKRAFLREYYQRLFARIRHLDSSPALAAHIDLLSRAVAQNYAPKRVVGGEDNLSSSGVAPHEGGQR